MCLCSETEKAGLSIVDWARAVGAPTGEIEEWRKNAGCICDKIKPDMRLKVVQLFLLWEASQNENTVLACSLPQPCLCKRVGMMIRHPLRRLRLIK